MDVLVVGGRDEQEVEGGCERICSTACGVVSPAGRRDAGITESSAEPKPGQKESEPSPEAVSPAVSPASSSGADEAAADKVCTIPAESEGLSAHDSETREAAVEGDSRGELTEVIELPELDDMHPEVTTEVIGQKAPSAPVDDDADDESDRPQLSTSAELPADFDWRKLTPRVYGKSLPPLDPADRQTLKESIISRGFVGSRILIDKLLNIVDGNHRWTICMETGIAPAVEMIQGLSEDEEQRELEKEELALSCNLDRRQLDKEDASQVFEARLDNLLNLRQKDSKTWTLKKIAELLSVSIATVSARRDHRHISAGENVSVPDARRKYDDELKREAVRLVKEGMPHAEVSRKVLIPPKTLQRAVNEEKERESGGGAAKSGKLKKAAAAKPPQPIEDITASHGVPELHRRANEHLKRDDHAYIEQLKASAAQARKDVETVSNIHKLQELSLSYGLILAFVDLQLRKMLPGDSKPNTAGNEPAPILLGSVMAYEQEEVFVALSSGGGGVIDNRSDFLAMYGRPKADEVVRVRVEGFDWKRGLWKLQPQARQTVAPAPGAIAGSHRDDRFSPDTKLAGRKAGPKNKEVTK